MAFSLGVDLGTTYIAAATARAGRTEMFNLGNQSMSAPAMVYQGPNGDPLVTGEAAQHQLTFHPERVGRDFKRRLGDKIPLMLGGAEHEVTTLLAALLSDVMTRVVRYEGAAPDSVLLTHPANWGPYRRGLFEEVPQLAGVAHTTTATEPEAAATHYANSRTLVVGETLGVYDLGGGTFDATVLRKHENGIEILGTEGVERLGGIDFDDAILTHVNRETGGALDALDMRDPQNSVAIARLRMDCISAKEVLSGATETAVPVFLPHRYLEVPITRDQFEDLVRADIESTITAFAGTLRSAHVTPADLSAILLVGGSSQIPLVTRMVSEQFGRPVVADVDPKKAIALGAAALADGHAPPAESPGSPPGDPGGGGRRQPPDPPVTPGASSPGGGAPTKPPRRPAPRAGVLLALLVVVLLLAGGVAWATWFRPQPGPPLPPPTPPTPASVTSSDTATVSTTFAVAGGPQTLAISPDGSRLYLTSATSLVVMDGATGRVVATVPVAGSPQFVVVSPVGHRAYVSAYDPAFGQNVVAVFDTQSNAFTGLIPTGQKSAMGSEQTWLYGLAVSADGTRLYVPNHDSGTVSVIDTASDDTLAQIPAGDTPHWAALSPSAPLALITNHMPGTVTALNTATNTVTRVIPIGQGVSPHSAAFSPDGKVAEVTDYDGDTLSFIDPSTLSVATTIPVGRDPQSVAFAPDGRHSYVVNNDDNTVSVINTATRRVTEVVPVGAGAAMVVVAPDGRHAFVADQSSNAVTVLTIGS